MPQRVLRHGLETCRPPTSRALPPPQLQLDGVVDGLGEAAGGCERLLSTPVPLRCACSGLSQPGAPFLSCRLPSPPGPGMACCLSFCFSRCLGKGLRPTQGLGSRCRCAMWERVRCQKKHRIRTCQGSSAAQLHEAHQSLHDAVAADIARCAVALHGARDSPRGRHNYLHPDR